MRLSDAQAVAKIHTLSWQHAYRGIMDQDFLDSIDVKKREANWRNGIETDDPPLIRLVIEREGEVRGFATGLDNWARAELPDCDAELWTLYVHPDSNRQGYGQDLFRQFAVELRKLGKRELAVWVLSDNHPARKFYEKQGGVLAPVTKQFTIGSQHLNEVAYFFSL